VTFSNYFNYFTRSRNIFRGPAAQPVPAVAARLGAGRILEELGRALEAVLRGIDSAFEKCEPSGRAQMVNSLAWFLRP